MDTEPSSSNTENDIVNSSTVNEPNAPRTEPKHEPLSLESRCILYPQPSDRVWPLMLHDEKIRQELQETLPQMVDVLSHPVEKAERWEIEEIFYSGKASDKKRNWYFSEEKNGCYSVSSQGFTKKEPDGREYIYHGVKYTFDDKGRIIKTDYIEDNSYSHRGQTIASFTYTYDDSGYLIQHSSWGQYSDAIIDKFEYSVTADGKKTPVKMSRFERYDIEDSKPMVVDLANWEEWLKNNPNGYERVSKEYLKPEKLQIDRYSVQDHRRGLLFSQPEHLEEALIFYGEGNIPKEDTALTKNLETFSDESGPIGAALFAYSVSGDIGEFVRNQIMSQVVKEWEGVKQSKDPLAKSSCERHFDYDGLGHFHKTSVDVEMTKKGLELRLNAAYVGDQVEETLAKAIGRERGFRSASIEIPVNQTQTPDYFAVDVDAVCQKLGIPVDNAGNFVAEWFKAYKRDAQEGSYSSIYGDRPVLWEDNSRGITIGLVFERRDIGVDLDLQQFFDSDGTLIWGPLPKNVRFPGKDIHDSFPKIVIRIQPPGEPYDEETATRARDIVNDFTSHISQKP